MFCIIFIISDLLENFCLNLILWFIFLNVSCVLEKNVGAGTAGWSILKMYLSHAGSLYAYGLLNSYFFKHVLAITEWEVLKFLIVTMNLSISPFNFHAFALCIWKPCYLVYKYIGLLCLDELTFLSLWNFFLSLVKFLLCYSYFS